MSLREDLQLVLDRPAPAAEACKPKKKKKLKEESESVIDQLRKIVADQQWAKINGVMVDLFSANAALQVYDALNDQNKAHMAKLPIKKMMPLVYKMMARKVGA